MGVNSQNLGLNHRAVILIIFAMALLAVQEGIAKYLGQHLSVPQVVWARYASHAMLMLVILLPRHGFKIFKSKIPFLQTGRSLLLFTDTALFFTGLTMIGLAEATAIFFMAPLFVVLISIPLLGERVGWYSFGAIFVGFLGMLLIVRPGLDGFNIGGLMIVGSAVCMSLFNVSTRKLAGTDDLEVTMMFTAMVGFVVATIALPFFWTTPEGIWVWLGMVFMGGVGGVAHNLLIIAHEKEEASKLAPFMYSQIIFAIALGWVMFAMLPDMYTVIGSVIVIGSGLFLWKRGRVKAEDLEQL